MGVYLVKLLPSWFVLALLVVVLSYVAYKTFIKGRTLWNQEKMPVSVRIFLSSHLQFQEVNESSIQNENPEDLETLLGNQSDESSDGPCDYLASKPSNIKTRGASGLLPQETYDILQGKNN